MQMGRLSPKMERAVSRNGTLNRKLLLLLKDKLITYTILERLKMIRERYLLKQEELMNSMTFLELKKKRKKMKKLPSLPWSLMMSLTISMNQERLLIRMELFSLKTEVKKN